MATRRAARLRPPSETQVALSSTDSKFTGSLLEISPYGLSVKTSQKVEIGAVPSASPSPWEGISSAPRPSFAQPGPMDSPWNSFP